MHVFNAHRGQLGFHLPEALIIDNFAGGGGASMGLEMGFGRPVDVAINHNEEALSMHQVNHPDTVHYCESVWDVDPVEVCSGNPVELAWFSPDCKHFSKAKGGKPVEKKIRGLAWVVLRWAAKVNPNMIMLENVEEFKTWGPITQSNQPCPIGKGKTFRSFIRQLEGHGYTVEHNVLRACDFGAPTTRKRFFLVARRDGQAINWPAPTHGKPCSDGVRNGSLKPWKTAAQIIDWSIPCKSIFNRKKPLADNTMARIARGIKKFVLENPKPFIVRIGQTGFGGDRMQYDINTPLTTVTTKAEHCLVTPAIVPVQDNGELCMSFLAKHYGGGYTGAGTNLSNPIDTITSVDHHALITSHLVKFRGNETGQGVDMPVPTITAGGLHIGEVRAFLIKYYGTDTGQGVDGPLHTIPTRDRFGLITVKGQDYQIIDIGMRMLEPHELFAAQGFPEGYIHNVKEDGKPLSKKAQVRMCGNSVSPPVVEALVNANLYSGSVQEVA